mmetsp:Transcript_13861/g.25109  ORF Transcript_13861/g.25109 Transcript_13861/m.25109 type:complete len:207 (+) Transcript_13861:858-1478(+)
MPALDTFNLTPFFLRTLFHRLHSPCHLQQNPWPPRPVAVVGSRDAIPNFVDGPSYPIFSHLLSPLLQRFRSLVGELLQLIPAHRLLPFLRFHQGAALRHQFRPPAALADYYRYLHSLPHRHSAVVAVAAPNASVSYVHSPNYVLPPPLLCPLPRSPTRYHSHLQTHHSDCDDVHCHCSSPPSWLHRHIAAPAPPHQRCPLSSACPG